MDTMNTPSALSKLPAEIKGLILEQLSPEAYLAMGQVNRDWFEQTHSTFYLRRQLMSLPNCCPKPTAEPSFEHERDGLKLVQALVQSTRSHPHHSQCVRHAFWREEFDWDVDAITHLPGDFTWQELLYVSECLQRT